MEVRVEKYGKLRASTKRCAFPELAFDAAFEKSHPPKQQFGNSIISSQP